MQIKLLIVLIMVLITLSPLKSQDDNTSSFAYIQTFHFEDYVTFINPSLGESVTKPYLKPDDLNIGLAPYYGPYLSPTGQWLASLAGREYEPQHNLHLWNIKSGETRLIPLEGWDYVYTTLKNIVWSPDEQKVALTLGERFPDKEDIELYIYDLVSDTLSKASNDTFDQLQAYWSADSRFVITLTNPCTPPEYCAYRLDIYEVGQQVTFEKSIALDDMSGIGSFACDISTSPDSRYITFVSICPVGQGISTGLPNQLYVWDRMTDVLTPITSYGLNTDRASFELYQYHWLDTQTLLVGVDYIIQEDPVIIGQELLLYHLPNIRPEILSEKYGANYVYNPITQQLFLSPTLSPIFESMSPLTSLDVISLQNVLTQGRSAFGNIERFYDDIPLFCGSFVSPNGEWLAIAVAGSYCGGGIPQLIFVSLTDPQEKPYTISVESPLSIIPLGWISN